MKTTPIPYFKLSGEEEESFYQLGLKDSLLIKEYSEEVYSLYFPSFFTPNLRKAYLRTQGPKEVFHNSSIEKLCKAYTEGLKWKYEDYLQLLLIPELLNSFSGRIPGFSKILQACSSAFILDEKNGPLHLRYLDYPLFASHTGFERVIEYQHNGIKILSHGLVGMPFAGISSVSNEGFSLSLHQKVSPDSYDYGHSIFGILHELLHQVKDLSDLKSYLKSSKSISRWGLYGCFQNGEVFEADLWGKNLAFETTILNSTTSNWKYVNNQYLGSDYNKKTQPYLFPDYCQWRVHGFEQKRKKQEKTETFIRDFFSPSLFESTEEFALTPATLCAYTASIFSPRDFSLLCQQGPPPKLDGPFQFFGEGDEAMHSKRCHFKPNSSHKKAAQVFRFLAKAQRGIHEKDMREAYHYLQMAKEISRETSWWSLTEFYFLVVQYLEATWEKEYVKLSEEFKRLIPELPQPFQDFAHLFILRCHVIGHQEKPTTPEIHTPGIQLRYEKESALKATQLKIFKKFLVPRIDILDIIHLYE